MGNLTRDPELKQVGEKGTSLVTFTVAVSRKFKRSDNTSDKEVTYIDCEAWDSGAETIFRHFKKGDPIVVHCSAKTESWVDEQTQQKRSRTRFRVDQFDFVASNRKREGEVASAPAPQGKDDDIPF